MTSRELLEQHGWETKDNTTFKHTDWPNEEIVVGAAWVHTELDFNNPNDKRVKAQGTSTAELKAHLESLRVATT